MVRNAVTDDNLEIPELAWLGYEKSIRASRSVIVYELVEDVAWIDRLFPQEGVKAPLEPPRTRKV